VCNRQFNGVETLTGRVTDRLDMRCHGEVVLNEHSEDVDAFNVLKAGRDAHRWGK